MPEEQAAGDRAGCDGEARGGRPHRDRLGPLAPVAEDGRDDRERRRHDQRAADAHQRAGSDQLAGRAGERRECGAGAEDDQSCAEREPPAEAVGEAAGGEQQAGEDEHVRVDDPLELARGRVQRALEGRQRDVEDRVVERDHEQTETEHRESPPAAPMEGFGVHFCIS